jgi:3-hydroxy-9,10-secoandrosta-1,3,5(10)-triene-9,17-dione monooxygenase
MTAASSEAPSVVNIPTPEELLARARALAPVLADRADECERLGRLPDASNKAFEEAGFYRILQPALYGGYQHFPSAFYNVLIELSKACPSSGWNVAVLGIHNWMMGLVDPRISEDILGKDSNTRFSTSLAPTGEAKKVQDGYILNGRWSWCSACDHSSWVMPGAITENDQGEPELIAFFVPRKDYEIDHDSWQTSGMRGTGSKTVILENVFVPNHRRYFIGLANIMADPGRAKFTSDVYKVSFATAFSYALASVALGIADGALEYSIKTFRERKHAYDLAAYQNDPPVQSMFAEVHSMLDGIHLKMERDMAEMQRLIREEGEIPMVQRVSHRWHTAEIPRVAKNAVNLLAESSGGSMFMNSNPMQRYFRDINCIANHRFINYNEGSSCLGYHMLTGENSNPFL